MARRSLPGVSRTVRWLKFCPPPVSRSREIVFPNKTLPPYPGRALRPPICTWARMSKPERSVKATSEQALSRFATRAQRAIGLRGDVNICITCDRGMRALNRRFRRKNVATDVLSFPSQSPGVAGDIAISLEIAARNSPFRRQMRTTFSGMSCARTAAVTALRCILTAATT